MYLCNRSTNEVHLGRFAASTQSLETACQLKYLQCLVVSVGGRGHVRDHAHSTSRTAQTFLDQLRQLALSEHTTNSCYQRIVAVGLIRDVGRVWG